MRGRVDSEPEVGDPMPHGKRKFLSMYSENPYNAYPR